MILKAGSSLPPSCRRLYSGQRRLKRPICVRLTPAEGHRPGVPLCHPPLCAFPFSGRFLRLASECSPLCEVWRAGLFLCAGRPPCRAPGAAPGPGQRGAAAPGGQRAAGSGRCGSRRARGKRRLPAAGWPWPVFMYFVVITFLTLPAG